MKELQWEKIYHTDTVGVMPTADKDYYNSKLV